MIRIRVSLVSFFYDPNLFQCIDVYFNILSAKIYWIIDFVCRMVATRLVFLNDRCASRIRLMCMCLYEILAALQLLFMEEPMLQYTSVQELLHQSTELLDH